MPEDTTPKPWGDVYKCQNLLKHSSIFYQASSSTLEIWSLLRFTLTSCADELELQGPDVTKEIVFSRKTY